MKYVRPRLPKEEIEMCLELFDKNEAKKRILSYIEGLIDNSEGQYNMLKKYYIEKATLTEVSELLK